MVNIFEAGMEFLWALQAGILQGLISCTGIAQEFIFFPQGYIHVQILKGITYFNTQSVLILKSTPYIAAVFISEINNEKNGLKKLF